MTKFLSCTEDIYMKNLFVAAVILALVLTPTFALQAVQQQQQPQQGQQPAQPAPKPPRVLGQPQTREEYDKYVAITQATDNQQRVKLSEDFLKDFPDSGLTPYVHQFSAK